jgi:hypothetical protein
LYAFSWMVPLGARATRPSAPLSSFSIGLQQGCRTSEMGNT